MNTKLFAISTLLLCFFAGCGENQPPAPSPSAGTLNAPPPPIAASAHRAGANPSIVAPPKDARYTLFCQDIEGPDHTEQANHLKQLWAQATGRNEWYVIHQENDSILYFGYYRSYNDPADAQWTKRAQADRQFVANLKNSIGDQPFMQSIFVPLDSPDPTAPPEWNLLNANGFWSVEIGSCTGQDRKSRAVESVREARAEGIEAYYFHGDGVSSICIGSFPMQAVQKQQEAVAKNNNAEVGVAVIPGSMADQVPGQVVDEQGHPMSVLHAQLTVQDPAMIALMNKFPLHSLNGMEYPGKPSAVVQIPKKGMSAQPAISDRPNVDLLGGTPTRSTNSNGGRLRSLGN